MHKTANAITQIFLKNLKTAFSHHLDQACLFYSGDSGHNNPSTASFSTSNHCSPPVGLTVGWEPHRGGGDRPGCRLQRRGSNYMVSRWRSHSPYFVNCPGLSVNPRRPTGGGGQPSIRAGGWVGRDPPRSVSLFVFGRNFPSVPI